MASDTHVVCGHCQAVVRVPAEKIGQAPHCPRCHELLFDGHPLTLSTAAFDTHLHRSDLPIVVDFWAPWCGPCQAMAPRFEQAARQMEPKARFAKVNSDEEPNLAARFNIRSIPTLLVLRQGREIARQSGAMDTAALTRWLERVLAS
jgi:thioredoxin 2